MLLDEVDDGVDMHGPARVAVSDIRFVGSGANRY